MLELPPAPASVGTSLEEQVVQLAAALHDLRIRAAEEKRELQSQLEESNSLLMEAQRRIHGSRHQPEPTREQQV